MDKPQLLQDIISNHSDVSIDLIKKLAQEEIDRQIKVSIDGMLYKKPIGVLRQVIEYTQGDLPMVKQADFDSVNLGSSPSLPTNKVLRKKRK